MASGVVRQQFAYYHTDIPSNLNLTNTLGVIVNTPIDFDLQRTIVVMVSL